MAISLLGRRAVVAIVLAIVTVAPGVTARSAQPPDRSPPVVYAAGVDSIIHPVSAEYMIETIDRADRAGAALVVFTLERPAVSSIRRARSSRECSRAKTPVAVFVGPPEPARPRPASSSRSPPTSPPWRRARTSARASGAGAGETMDRDDGEEGGRGRRARTSRTLCRPAPAERRPRCRGGTRQPRVHRREALHASPPLIDLVATDLPDLLRAARRPLDHAASTARRVGAEDRRARDVADRDELAPARAQRDRASQHRLPAAEPRACWG